MRLGAILLAAAIPAGISLGASASIGAEASATTSPLSLVASAGCGQGLLLQPGAGLTLYEQGPNLQGYPLLQLGPVLSGAQANELHDLLQTAAATECGDPTGAEFDPYYAFRFATGEQTVDFLLPATCDVARVYQGKQSLTIVTYYTECIAEQLRSLMTAVFGKDSVREVIQAN